MELDVQISAAELLDNLGHIELGQKHLGLVNHGYGVRLAIVEVMRLAAEARKRKTACESGAGAPIATPAATVVAGSAPRGV